MRVLTAFCCVIMAGCALSPKDTGTAHMFSLHPVKSGAESKTYGEKTLTVVLPEATSELDTYRVALVRGSGFHDYYASTKWTDFLPVLVQDALVSTLMQSGGFKTVTADSKDAGGDYILKTNLRIFHAAYSKDGGAPVVNVEIAGDLTDRSHQKAVQSFNVRASRVVSQDNLASIQAAFEDAFNGVQRQIVRKATAP